MSQGVAEFVCALRQFLVDWPQCDTVAVTFRMPGGALLTVRSAGPLWEIEDDSGNRLAMVHQ